MVVLSGISLRVGTCAADEDVVSACKMRRVATLVLDHTTTSGCALDSGGRHESNESFVGVKIVARGHLRTA